MFNKFLERQSKIVRNTDPSKIYVENVRSFFHIPNRAAKLLCEMAVKEGLFKKKFGAVCPSCSRIIKSYSKKSRIDSELLCEVCQDLDESRFKFSKEELQLIEFYQLASEK